MTSTGMVRRIDDLGRIVIPKEIRKTLRIHNGDNLEIYLEKDDKIVLRKFSLVNKISDFAQDFTDSIYSFIKKNIIITDRDQVIAASGSYKKDILKKPIGKQIEQLIHKRDIYSTIEASLFDTINQTELYGFTTIVPIIANGDSLGSIILVSENLILEEEIRIIQIASQFFAKYLEE